MKYLLTDFNGERSLHDSKTDVAFEVLSCKSKNGLCMFDELEKSRSWDTRPKHQDIVDLIVDKGNSVLKQFGFEVNEIPDSVSMVLKMMIENGIPHEAIVMPSIERT